MQKIFVRRFLMIMITTVLITVLFNSLIQAIFAERAAIVAGENAIAAIAERIDSNNRTIQDLTESLNENYLTRVRAFSEIIAQNPNIVFDVDELVRMTVVLNVDEVHVTDEFGILRWSNDPSYAGLDFATTDQTRPFLPALKDKRFELAQEPQPSGSIGKLIQYVGVARQDKPGIVQVGVRPEVLDDALANNKIDVVIDNFNVNQGKEVFAIHKQTGLIAGDTARQFIGRHYADLGIPSDFFEGQKKSDWITLNGQRVFAVFGDYDDYVIGVASTSAVLSAERKNQNIVSVICCTLLGITILVAVFISLKKTIIKDIELVNGKLKQIADGDLETTVDAKATPELALLSRGINDMVDSLKRQMNKISHQAAELEERNANILSSLHYARRIQNNLLPTADAFSALFADCSILWEPKEVVGGDVYWVKHFADVSVLCVCDCTGHGTPGALLTMLTVTALEAVVTEETCQNPAEILWLLDQTLSNTLNASTSPSDINDGADMAVLSIKKDGCITLASAKTHLFICDGTSVQTIRGQKISLGSKCIGSQDEINAVSIPANPQNRYYAASDGLFDQIGEQTGLPWGYRKFKSVILDNYALPQQEISSTIWSEFLDHMGNEAQRDDITLLSFRLKETE